MGGGLIAPMSRRWDSILDRASEETQNIKNEASSTGSGVYPEEPVLSSEPTQTLSRPATTASVPRRVRRTQ